MTGSAEWGLVRQPGLGITGVYSLSAQKPIKRTGFPERYESFSDAASYKDWKFVYLPGAAGNTPQPQSNPQSQPKPPPPKPPAEPQPPVAPADAAVP